MSLQSASLRGISKQMCRVICVIPYPPPLPLLPFSSLRSCLPQPVHIPTVFFTLPFLHFFPSLYLSIYLLYHFSDYLLLYIFLTSLSLRPILPTKAPLHPRIPQHPTNHIMHVNNISSCFVFYFSINHNPDSFSLYFSHLSLFPSPHTTQMIKIQPLQFACEWSFIIFIYLSHLQVQLSVAHNGALIISLCIFLYDFDIIRVSEFSTRQQLN